MTPPDLPLVSMAVLSPAEAARRQRAHRTLNIHPNQFAIMVQPKTILILGFDQESPIAEALFDLGFIPIFRDEMLGALQTLRHDRFRAALVDLRNNQVDVLEFILNVRDIVPHMPVVIVGELDAHLKDHINWDQLNATFLIPDARKLKKQLDQHLNARKEV